MKHYVTILCAALVTIIGCGDGAPATSDAAVTPTVVSANVQDGDVEISILVELEASLSHGILSAALDGASVRVSDEYGSDVPGTISYEEVPRTIRFTPEIPLEYGTRYTWQMMGIQTSDGQSLADWQVGFTTYFNLERRQVFYSPDSGDISGHTDTRVEDTHITHYIGYGDLGDDGEWFTADDGVGWYTHSLHDEHNVLVQIISYIGAGPDLQWMTDDDVIALYNTMVYDQQGRVASGKAYRSGADETWFTADDQVLSATVHSYRPDGRTEGSATSIAAGADGEWLTADDELANITHHEYDARGLRIQSVYYKGPGSDGQWDTQDDEISSYLAASFDTRGLRQTWRSSNAPGPDEVWFTDDDHVSSHGAYTYDALGNITESNVFTAPGPDGIWMTDDDARTLTVEYDGAR